MIIIIPLGGIGERFKNNGYKKPKALINILGKPMIYWLIDNLNLATIDMIVIPYNLELLKFNFEEMIKNEYPMIKFKFICLMSQTKGAADTILTALSDMMDDTCPVLCLDVDNFYKTDIISKWAGNTCVFYINDDSGSEQYSFIKYDDNMRITDIMEKQRISSNACTGAYGFSSITLLRQYCSKLIESKIQYQKEYYISGVIKLLVNDGITVLAKEMDRSKYICVGTPFDVRLFCNNYPRIDVNNSKCQIQSKRYCFDLDNTIVTYPEIHGDYTTVKPIQHMIDYVTYLKRLGHIIIIYTARRMKTHNGNIGKITAEISKITIDTLDKFNVPYDEIYFGKPYADYYIDDRAISAFDDLEKELGFYKSNIDTRSFNTLSNDIVHTYKKYGKQLSGEIYWYENMPNNLKDMFPFYFGCEANYYIMERINGVCVSKLYISGELTFDHLMHIMNSLDRIHDTTIPVNETNKFINIYDNYSKKVKNRYENYDYTKYRNSNIVYDSLITKLNDYEINDNGVCSIIHGDPVLTNIMFNQFGKIKFIDMRGRVGEQNTIIGDIFYDWAKLYQSLIGYDEILENTTVNIVIKTKLINYFESRIIEKYGYEKLQQIKLITTSLIFTLIPLHDNEKCTKYYDLMYTIYQSL